jgi:hypothetical protein
MSGFAVEMSVMALFPERGAYASMPLRHPWPTLDARHGAAERGALSRSQRVSPMRGTAR